MLYTIYKPNAKVTGGLATFRVKKQKKDNGEWESVLFVELLKQKNWNNENRTGEFDKESRKFIVLTPTEAGEFLNTFRDKIGFSTFHKSKKASTPINLTCYSWGRKVSGKDEKVINFGFSVGSGAQAIKVPFSPGEASALSVLLEHYIKESFSIALKEEEKRFKSQQKAPSKNSDDDIPF